MSTLTCFSSSYYYQEYLIASGDVADAITAIRTELLTRNNPVWTEPSTALFTSPVDAVGRFCDALFTRIDQQTLEIRVRNQYAQTVCTRRIQCGTAPWQCRIFSGQFHLVVECWSPGGQVNLYCGILDQSPDPQGIVPVYVYGGGFLSAAGGNDGQSSAVVCWMYDAMGSGSGDRTTQYGGSSTAAACFYHMNGAKIYKPVEMSAQYANNAWRVAGRRYQHLLCTQDLWYGTKVVVPIDNISGTFMVLALPTRFGMRMACRVA